MARSRDEVEINTDLVKKEMARFGLTADNLAKEFEKYPDFKNGNYSSTIIKRKLSSRRPVFVNRSFVKAFVWAIQKLHQRNGLVSQLGEEQLIVRNRTIVPTDHGAQLWEDPNRFSGSDLVYAFRRLLIVFSQISDFLESNIHFRGYAGALLNAKGVKPPTTYSEEQRSKGVYGFIIVQFKKQYIPLVLTVSYRHWITAIGYKSWGPIVNYGQIVIESDGIKWWEIWKQVEWPKLPVVAMDCGNGLTQIAIKTWLDCDDKLERPNEDKFFIHGGPPLENCYMTLDEPPPECPVAEFPPGIINRKSNMWLSWRNRKLLSTQIGDQSEQPPHFK